MYMKLKHGYHNTMQFKALIKEFLPLDASLNRIISALQSVFSALQVTVSLFSPNKRQTTSDSGWTSNPSILCIKYDGHLYLRRAIMLLKMLVMRMSCLAEDIDALYDVARDSACSTEARLYAAGTLTYFLSSTTQPLEHWLLDTLMLRLGLCTALAVMGRRDDTLQADVVVVKQEMSPGAVRRIECMLEKLASRAFAGGGVASVVMDNLALNRLYQQALNKAAVAPNQALSATPQDLCAVEALLVP